MSICIACENEMLTADSCIKIPVKIEDEQLDPVRYGDEERPVEWGPSAASEGRRCHDCGVNPGGFHHPGCDAEQCPKCRHQLISCGCLDEEIEEA